MNHNISGIQLRVINRSVELQDMETSEPQGTFRRKLLQIRILSGNATDDNFEIDVWTDWEDVPEYDEEDLDEEVEEESAANTARTVEDLGL